MEKEHVPQREEMTQSILHLYNQLSQKITSMMPFSSSEKESCSRDNLLAFLALREINLSRLQRLLQKEGLADLSAAETNVMTYFHQLSHHIGVKLSPPSIFTCPTNDEATAVLRERTINMFGSSAAPFIMVTMDATMVSEHGLMERLLLHGMNVARINCAHDSPSIWKALIDRIREAEQNLQQDGKHVSCKIYMDLGGPKIRVGPVRQTTAPVKLSIPRDVYGHKLGAVEGYINTEAENTMIHAQSDSPFKTFTLAVRATSSLQYITEGDELHFVDTRGKARSVTVVEKIDKNCIKVHLHDIAYVDEGTILHHDTVEMVVRSLVSVPEIIEVKKGDTLRLQLYDYHFHHYNNDSPTVTVTLPSAFKNVKVGDRIFIDDGKVHGIVSYKTSAFIDVNILHPSVKARKVREGNGFNLPDSLPSLNVTALTKKDIDDLPFIVQHADIVGLSFVHSPKDLMDLRAELTKLSAGHLPIVAKIETKDAIHHLGRILLEGLDHENFGVMIARGDLAVEVGFEHLAYVQQEILSMCRAAHVPVIWATQVLDRLLKKGIPSRAEITDAVMANHTQCIMLNKGPYVVEGVSVLTRLINMYIREGVDRNKVGKELTTQYDGLM
ncbi:pyruvate kinase [Bacillus sp. CGMCC 1.16541]|uniref:pyruvate kinase n=1 Tax=Bacillus sp. CGMCC 1.16541 TaxID=2185143 RepID=UPI0013A550B9|nr:pyruvate kinase [Bacillus sp. CGMCC 1.16541]